MKKTLLILVSLFSINAFSMVAPFYHSREVINKVLNVSGLSDILHMESILQVNKIDYSLYQIVSEYGRAACVKVTFSHADDTMPGSLIMISPELTECPNGFESKRVCGAIGTRSEGWYEDGRLIGWDNCSKL